MSPAKFAASLERRLKPLVSAQGFFTAERGSAYLVTIHGLTRDYLMTRPLPPTLTDEQWEAAVARFVSGIRVEILPSGFRFLFEGVPLVDQEGNARSDAVDIITFPDVQAWIEAGAQGDPLGKRIDPGEDHEEAAHLVYTAVHGKKRKDGSRSAPDPQYASLRDAIREWMQRSPFGFGKHFPALRKLWKNTLRPRYKREMAEYVRKTVRRA